MPVSNSKEPCTICTKLEPIMHSHHTVPRSRGGENSLQIQLCPTCHNLLHANALSIVAQIRRNGKGPGKTFFKPEENDRAQPYLRILVEALVRPLTEERQHTLTTTVPTSLFEELKILQQEMGLSSMEKTLALCMQYTISNLGVRHEEKKTNRGDSMWFLHVPK